MTFKIKVTHKEQGKTKRDCWVMTCLSFQDVVDTLRGYCENKEIIKIEITSLSE